MQRNPVTGGLARRGTHPRLAVDPAILSVAENREGSGSDSTSGACRISPLLMLLVTGLASVHGYFADAYKRA